MLRVGLTGGLGSGKTTVAALFSDQGACVISADEIGRRLMQPGKEVYSAILRQFGNGVLHKDGSLDRTALAHLAFQHNQGQALNGIVHPAVIAEQEKWMREVFARDPSAVAIVESALIFEVEEWATAPGWAGRFDKLILVTAPEEVRIERFVRRAMAARGGGEALRADLEADARARLSTQIPDEEKIARCDFVIVNTGPLEEIRSRVAEIYARLRELAAQQRPGTDH